MNRTTCTMDTLPDLPLDMATLKKDEYDIQFLGFSPKSLSDAIYNIFITYTWDFFESTHSEVQRISESETPEEGFNRASDKICGKLTKKTDAAFDKLESYLAAHIFHVRDNVLLPDDKNQADHPDAGEEIKKIRTEIQELKNGICQAKVYNKYLQSELSHLETANNEIVQSSHSISQLHDSFKEAGALDLREWTSFTVTEMQSLVQSIQDQPLLSPQMQNNEEKILKTSNEMCSQDR